MAEWGKIYLIVFVYFKCFEMWDGAKTEGLLWGYVYQRLCSLENTNTSVYKIKKNIITYSFTVEKVNYV